MDQQGPRIPIEQQNVFLAANEGKEAAEAPKSAFQVFPPRPKWLQYPKMYRNSNKRGAKRDVKKSSANTRTTPVPSVDSPQKTILNHFVHSPTTPRTSQSSPSVPSTNIFGNSHSGENLYFNLSQEDAIQASVQAIIIESSTAEEVEELEDEPAPAASTKTNRKPLKAIRKAFTRKKPEDEEDDMRRRSSVASEGSHKSPGQAEKTTDPARTGPMRSMFNKKSQSKRQLMFKEVSETEQMDYEDDHQDFSPVKRSVSPQDYLDAMIYARGYSTERHNTLQSAYFNRPTPLQEACYHTHMIDLVRSGNTRALRAHLECGMSPNPANTYGKTLLHKVCRVGRSRILQMMLDCGVDVRVADQNGRTPLHEACAANSLECFEIICDEDLRLLYMADRRNLVPLQYVPKNAWMDWIQLLEAKKDEFWPESRFGRRCGVSEPPPLFTLQAPNSRPLKDPPNALTIDVASLVASGQILPELAQDAMRMREERELAKAIQTGAEGSTSTNTTLGCLPLPRKLVHNMDGSDLESELTESSVGDAMKSGTADAVNSDRGEDGDEEAEEDAEETAKDDDKHTEQGNGTHDLDNHEDEELSSIEDELNSVDGANPSIDLRGTEQAMGVLGITPRYSPSYSL